MNPVEVSNVTKQVETMTVSSSTSSDDNGTDSSSANGAKLSSAPHGNFAGRYPAGIAQPITLAKNGVRHVSFGSSKKYIFLWLSSSHSFFFGEESFESIILPGNMRDTMPFHSMSYHLQSRLLPIRKRRHEKQ
jgi:hypothetical protein